MTQHDSDPHYYWKTPSIQTHVGLEFFPLDPKVESIDLRDVAHALSLKCRYTGHCLFFYSVGQHSVLMSRYLGKRGASLLDQKWALMHDASETYLPDVAGPIKRFLPDFCAIEDRVLQAVGARFELPWPKSDLVTHADRLMYWRERRALMRDVPWLDPAPDGLAPTDDIVRDIPIERWSPERAEAEFLDRFSFLFGTGSTQCVEQYLWRR